MNRRAWLAGLGLLALPVGLDAAWLTPFVQRARDHLQAERAYMATTGFLGLNTAYLAALSLTHYVNGHVSALVYQTMRLQGVPSSVDPETILSRESGLCQASQIAFLAVGQTIGLTMRPVYVWSRDDPTGEPYGAGHATVEVWYGGAWHWFDPTFGFYYRHPEARPDAVLGLLDVLALLPDVQAVARVQNNLHPLVSLDHLSGVEPDRFLDSPTLRIESPAGTVLYGR